ncbi:MAG: 3-oxoadipate enol-lactonase [Ardenticatenaceae bacterium]
MSKMRFTTVEGVTLHYMLDGLEEGLALVFINSLGSDLRIWNEVVPHFADRFRIVRYDKRGHGLSDAPQGPYSMRDHADDLGGLLAHLGVDEAVLIGLSVGGMIALDYTISPSTSSGCDYPRIRGLVLCDTAAKIGTVAYWDERIQAIRQNGMAPLAEPILSRWFSPAFIEQRPADYRGYHNMLTRTPLEGYAGTCEAIRDADLREGVGKIRVKSLVLCGSEDLATTPELVRGLADSLSDARFELVEGAAHLPCIEQPARMAQKIEQFLAV